MALLRASQMGVYPGGGFQEEDEEDPDVKRMKAPVRWVETTEASEMCHRNVNPKFMGMSRILGTINNNECNS